MASIRFSSRLLLPFSFLIFLMAIAASPILSLNLGGQGAVGGRTDVKDVAANREVQSLGRFAVEEYNRHGSSLSMTTAQELSFSEVVATEYQVVAGIKYFLKVAVKDYSDVVKTFDAVVVVKPWVKSKELLSFNPSTTS